MTMKGRTREMQETEIGAGDSREGERWCLRCKEIKPLLAFSQRKGKADVFRNICQACEQSKQEERRRRVAIQRGIWQEQQGEREERKQSEWERRTALRQTYEERQQERERWYHEQPDRHCRTCQQMLPATAFGGVSSLDGITLYTRCVLCHEALHERRQLPCCLCQQKIPCGDFLSLYDGYELCGNGTSISLCCKGCEAVFSRLSDDQRALYIHSCCQRALPAGQVIYAEIDPETNEIRYVGRTGNPKRRHAQHIDDVSPTIGEWGAEKKTWYTRSNWMYALAEKGLEPSMHILKSIEVSPLVIEWELRYIWHGIQQGWRLLNIETMDEKLVARVKASSINFLEASFETLVQQHFFSSHELVAFIRKWYQSKYVAE